MANCMANGVKLVERLLEQGGNYVAQRLDHAVQFRPTSERPHDLASFDRLVGRILGSKSDGMTVERTGIGAAEGLIVRLPEGIWRGSSRNLA